jgi:hypothetical protein
MKTSKGSMREMAQNQTKQEWLEASEPNTLGTGLFLVPDVQSDQVGAVQKVVVPDITYKQCIQRGMFVVAFKWVPHTIAGTPGLACSM